MSEKRRDKKGRILRNGESLREDGRYVYTYYNLYNQRKMVYSWKLEETDALPAGKRKCKALRELEREIARDINDQIVPQGGELTVVQLAEKYINIKTGVKPSTRMGYKTVIKTLKSTPFGQKRIDRVKPSDAKEFLIKLQKEEGKSYSSIHNIRGVLRPAFQMAVDDDLIRKNPFEFQMVSIIVNDTIRREAITHEEKRKFLNFVRNDEHFSQYYDAMYILFYTGMRISEFCGLTVKDIDLKKRTININKQLMKIGEGYNYHIISTKTNAGTRVLPMDNGVYECFKRIIENRSNPKVEPLLKDDNGNMYSGFLFLTKDGKPRVAYYWQKKFQYAVKKYNSIYKVPLPTITPHVCRHTYCTHCASAGMNPKTLQYLMGHSEIGVTLNTYTHFDLENIGKEVNKICIINE